MRNSITRLFILLAVAIFVQACNTEKDTPIVKDVVLNGKDSTIWELNRLTIDNGINQVIKMDLCLKDNRLVFRKNLTYRILNGETKCDKSEPSVLEEGLWDVTEHQERIYFFPTDENISFNGWVEDAAETRIIYEVVVDDSLTYQYTYLLEGVLSSF